MDNLAKEDVSGVGLKRESASHLTTHYEEKNKIGWCYMHASPRPCFTPQLLQEIKTWLTQVKQEQRSESGREFRYHVLASSEDGVFNLGGDLNLFRHLIEEQDRQGLQAYAKACIDVLHDNIVHFGLDVTSIALVQGDALGGGFEAAISSNVLIAERDCRMGLPEILFNLFPGMGAYNLLSRRIGPAKAEQMILSGQLFTSDELFEMGVVDILAEKGEGELALYNYIKRAERASNGYRAMREVRDLHNPISYGSLAKVTNLWVDGALRLRERDLRMMERLVSRQTRQG